MKSFFKENLVLVAGVALPLLLTIIFFAATQVGKVAIEPPQHELIFISNKGYNSPYRVNIQDKQVHFTYRNPDNNNNYRDRDNKPSLYVYDPATGESREIELPKVSKTDTEIDVVVPALSSEVVSGSKESPDGYRFEYVSRGGGNLMTEIFGGGYRSRSGQTLYKGSQRIKVPHAERHGSLFVGWIINDHGADDE